MDWYYTVGSEGRGPVDEATLRSMIASGELASDAQIRHENAPNWSPIAMALPPKIKWEEHPAEAPVKPVARRWRSAYFGILLLNTTLSVVESSLFLTGAYDTVFGIRTFLFLVLVVLVPIAIIEGTRNFSLRMLLYILTPVALKIISLAWFAALALGPESFGETYDPMYSIQIAFGDVFGLICVMIAVDGFARLREEAIGN